jgi:hypothetical protein
MRRLGAHIGTIAAPAGDKAEACAKAALPKSAIG